MAQTHHYLFDTSGTYNDATGSSNFTNVYGSIASGGVVNQCYKTAGYNFMDPVNAYTSANILPTSGAFSVAFWIKSWSGGSNGGTAIRLGSTGMYFIGYGKDSEFGVVQTMPSFTSKTVYNAFDNVSWHHLAFIWSGTTWTIYRNGSVPTQYGTNFTPNSATYNSSTRFEIVTDTSGGGYYIDDLRVYDTAIDSTEVTFLYNSGSGTQSNSGGGGGGGSPSPVTSAFYKFQPFVEAAMEGIHNFGSHQLKVALTDTAPSAANAVLADISEIASYAGCSTRNVVTSTSAQISGTYKLVCNELVLTASGAVGPFRYVVLYNDTAASDNLIAYYDYASSVTLASGDTFTIGFNGTTGVLTVT